MIMAAPLFQLNIRGELQKFRICPLSVSHGKTRAGPHLLLLVLLQVERGQRHLLRAGQCHLLRLLLLRHQRQPLLRLCGGCGLLWRNLNQRLVARKGHASAMPIYDMPCASGQVLGFQVRYTVRRASNSNAGKAARRAKAQHSSKAG